MKDVMHKKPGAKIKDTVKVAIRKKVENALQRNKTVAHEDSLKWCDREQCAAFFWRDRGWPLEKGGAYFDKEEKLHKKFEPCLENQQKQMTG